MALSPRFQRHLPGRRVRNGQLFEPVEQRVLLTAAVQAAAVHLPVVSDTPLAILSTVPRSTAAHTNVQLKHAASSGPTGLTPSQMRDAYGLDQVMFGSVAGDGTGQTIAIIDAYNYPTALSDVNQFSAQFGLPTLQAYSAGGNSSAYLRIVSETGSNSLPGTDPAGPGTSDWEVEEALDLEWAHSIAPGANLILVEANSASDADLINNAVNWARNAPGVSVVSMSFSGSESSSETSLDSLFTTPSGHNGVTFFAATGDTGKPSGYPAYSPNVVAVGGTTLSVSGNSYVSESGWSGSGGGLSTVEAQPSYQTGVVTQSSTARPNPDVSMDADPNSGVPIYDSYDFGASTPWAQYGGTSLATPMWAGIMAVIDQGLTINGQGTLDGATQTLPKLYQLPASDFHDITTGNNGYAAGPGYDLVTGRGSPVANQLISDMIAVPSAAPGTPVLSASSDTGASNSDDITKLNNSSSATELQFSVSATIPGATVNLFADGNLIGSAIAGGSTTLITTSGSYTLADGAHAITATQMAPGMGQSAPSAALSITVLSSPLSVTTQTPSGPVAGAQGDLRLAFSAPVDTTTFSLSDVTTFSDPAGDDLRGQITGFSWSAGNTVLDILFTSQSAVGTYQFAMGPGIMDLAGNAMAAPYTGSFTIIAAVYSATMDTNPGWTFDAGSLWAWGKPAGAGSHNHDPSSGHTGTNVIGYNLNGDYSRNTGPYYAATPAINCSNYQNLTLTFWRWLGVRSSATASVQASPDGGVTWITLWTNSGATISDNAWVQQTFTLPASFNGKSAVKIRWGMGPTGSSNTTYPGWNIDDVLITGAPTGSISGQVFLDANGNGVLDSGETGIAGATVFLDINNNGILDPTTTSNFTSTNVPLSIPDDNPTGVTSSLAVSGTAGLITQVTITFNITHTYDSDLIGYLTAPDGTKITLWSNVGGSGHNFTNTTLSDLAATSIAGGAAPFSGTYAPSPGTLSTFNGKTANGAWQFTVADVVAQDVGTINSWSLSITSGEPSTTTDANGNYSFNNISPGAYTVREVVPAGDFPLTGVAHTINVTGAVTGQNFAVFPSTFTTSATGAAYYLRMDSTDTYLQIFLTSAPSSTPAYQIALNLLPALTFNFNGLSENLFVDLANGSPAAAGLILNATSGNNDQLNILGNSPSQAFTLTDSQIGPAGGGMVSYNGLDNLYLQNGTFASSSDLSTLQNLILGTGATFLWNQRRPKGCIFPRSMIESPGSAAMAPPAMQAFAYVRAV